MRLLHVPGTVVNEQGEGGGVVEHQGGQKWRTGYRLKIAYATTR
jgi:hypothetical protein